MQLPKIQTLFFVHNNEIPGANAPGITIIQFSRNTPTAEVFSTVPLLCSGQQ